MQALAVAQETLTWSMKAPSTGLVALAIVHADPSHVSMRAW